MIKKVLQMGNPDLAQEAKAVTLFDTPELHQLIADLFDTMKANAGVGLAAPQIGIPLRVIVLGFQSSPRYPNEGPVPEATLINPTYQPVGQEKTEIWEGCLTMKGLRGKVPRYQTIHYQAYDAYGVLTENIANGFHARIIQHEIDHLQGILYIERIQNLKNFAFERELSLF